MDGMLSQDEINALLNGMDLSEDGASEDGGSGGAAEASSSEPVKSVEDYGELLTEVERDAIGEVANISMGSSATTLYSLVNRKVNITTPKVEIATWNTLMGDYERPCVFIQIRYTVGLDGTNMLVLKEHDVKVITDLMMGGDGTNTDGELGELHLSAISEAMNQMMGSAATSLSTMLKTTIDISPPDSSLLDLTQVKDGASISPFLGGAFVKISFRMQIDDLVDSTIMQLYPVDFAKKVVDTFIGSQMGGAAQEPAPQASAPGSGMEQAAQAGMPQGGMDAQMGMAGGMQMGMPQGGMDAQMGMGGGMQTGMPQGGMNPQMMQMGMPQGGMNPQMMQMGMPQGGMNPQMMQMGMPMQAGMYPMGMVPMGMNPQALQSVNVQPAQFQNFSNDVQGLAGQENIGLIMDVPLEVTVELGRTSKSISEILNFTPGTIIELDRIAGEPIDVLVNGKFVAKGEVVVIEESFGIRVTEIIK